MGEAEAQVPDAFRQLWPLTLASHEWPPLGANFDTSGLDLLEGPLHDELQGRGSRERR
jgi:hypothetical protein